MPELPEVETIAADLEARLPGLAILETEVHRALPIALLHPATFCGRVTGERFASVSRRGKYLLFNFASGAQLIVHLRMTGSWQYQPAGEPPARHTHVVFHLDNGYELRYRDPRCFGRLYLVRAGESAPTKGLRELGPEPFAPEFNAGHLGRALAGRNVAIKQVLLDQRVAAGVGNIYADEALFLAHLHPTRVARSLKPAQLKTLAKSIRQALQEGIDHRGTTLRDYVDSTGLVGQHQDHLRVYGRAGEPCIRCGTPIEWLRLAGRSSHFCPACQK